MSITLIKILATNSALICKANGCNITLRRLPDLVKTFAASYSKRSDSKNINGIKVVKSKIRVDDNRYLELEGGPNWEILAPRGNRFYLPNAVGPAWQGANTTITLDAPLESLVDFEGNATAGTALLKFNVNVCPSLIKKSLYELFPTSEVISSERLAIVILSFNGDVEIGARKFVLAAREITSRLRLHGYWADFINPFSGKPFYAWANNKNLYQTDERFRGLNMKFREKNRCIVITSADDEHNFSGIIYTNGPADYSQVKTIINTENTK